MANEIPDLNLFMMCQRLNTAALRALPPGFHFRACRRDELDVWCRMQVEGHPEHIGFLQDYHRDVYAPQADAFFRACVFACDQDDTPIGSCFVWKAYGMIQTIHWFKVLTPYEGRGIGRALLGEVMRPLAASDYPVYLHTHPSSYRAVKLYADMGFALLTDPVVGSRTNDLAQSLPILKQHMPKADYDQLTFAAAPRQLLDAAASSELSQF